MCITKKLILLFICVFISVPAFGQKIQVVTEEFGPYNYSEDGKVVGFSTEIVKELLTRAKLDYSIRVHPWAESYEIAKTQPNVLIYSIGRNVEREPLFKWVPGSLVRLEVFFFKLKSRRDIRIKSLDDAKKYKIGAVRDDFRAQFLAKEGFALDLVPDDNQNIRNLFGRKIDLFPADEMVAYHIAHQEGHAFNDMEKMLYIKDVSVDLHIALSMQTSDALVEKCGKALRGIKKDGTYEKIKSQFDIFHLPIFKFGSF